MSADTVRHIFCKSRRRIFILCAVFVLVTFMYSQTRHLNYYTKRNTISHSCQYYKDRLAYLVKLIQDVNDALEKNNLHHFVLYGSVWGVLRGYKGPLPWDNDADFGIMYTPGYYETMEQLCKDIKLKNIHCIYGSGGAAYRFYYLEPKNELDKNVVLDLFLYKPFYLGWTRRLGWENMLIPIHYFMHQTFPLRLVDGDLEFTEFAGRKIRKPRGGIEVMKYLYRDDWQSIKSPADYNCGDVKTVAPELLVD